MAQTKESKADAAYQAKPYEGQQCSGCTMFLPPSGCSAVAGVISPDGWCSHFTAKTARQPTIAEG